MSNKDYTEKLIKEYSNKEATKLDELRALDKKVKIPALVFAYVYGIIGSLILGVGMCLAMEIIGKTTAFMVVGIIVGIIGIIMVSSNYAIYHKILSKRKAKYSKEILEKASNI